MPRIKKPFEKPPQSPPNGQAQPAPQWWRPLTSGWCILGLIIFAGLVLRSIDLAGSWLAAQFDRPSIEGSSAIPIRPSSSLPSK
jgi:hypothetical protein